MTFNTLSVETRNAIMEEVADSILNNWGNESIKIPSTLESSIDTVLAELDLLSLRKHYRASKRRNEVILEWDEFIK